MNRTFLSLIVSAITGLTALHAQQVTGTVTDTDGEPLPFVNIYLENSYTGTTSNEQGQYRLDVGNRDEATVVFQFLGYKTLKKQVSLTHRTTTLNARMEPEAYSLDPVLVSSDEDPAYRVIRQAIAHRKEHLEKVTVFTADFYSRGLIRVADIPEKILGQEVGDFDSVLDSTRTGILYLSETVSEIAYDKPRFKERIKSSLVSGDDYGFSFNSAQAAHLDFYENIIPFGQLVSPIANNALSHYNYRLEGAFYTEDSQLINKIAVLPKRPNDRVFSGFVFIAEDIWQLYGVELTATGANTQVPFLDEITFRHNFTYDTRHELWVKISQTIDFGAGIFGMKIGGRFVAGYSDYNLEPEFENGAFGREALYFEREANRRDSTYWERVRPVPLTGEEAEDYVKKDSIQQLRRSPAYLDSIDRENNKFKPLNPITGYTYNNSYKKWKLDYSGIVGGTHFNTLQGWHGSTALGFRKQFDENNTRRLSANLGFNYGFADDRLRLHGRAVQQFNAIDYSRLTIAGGNTVQQFNRVEPISPLLNSITSLFFERNYLKAYDLTYGRMGYGKELLNGIRFDGGIAYEKRQPLFNRSEQIFYRRDNASYTSNNPLEPDNFDNAAIDPHEMLKVNLDFRINFAQRYATYPDRKVNFSNKYPTLYLQYEKGFSPTRASYDFDHVQARVRHSQRLGNKGRLNYHLRSGTFFNADSISFADYKHFNGNQTRINASDPYVDVFNLLPYYRLSTDRSYFEAHAEHDFRGYILGKIPLINKLNFNLVAGGHILFTEQNKPYSELSVGMDNIGFSNFRFIRVDYVQSFYGSERFGAFVFGLKFLGLIQ